MNDIQDFHKSRSFIGRVSRSAVGRVSRYFGGAATLQVTRRFLRRQLWAWPIIAAVVLGTSGWWVDRCVEDAMRRQREAELNTIVDASVASLRLWMTDQQRSAEMFAADESLQPLVQELLVLAHESPTAQRQLVLAPAQAALRARLADRLRYHGYVGFLLVSPGGIVLAADQDIPVGKTVTSKQRLEFYHRAFEGHPGVTKPYRSRLLLADSMGELRPNLPSMLVAAPIKDKADKTLAVLSLRIRPDDEFTSILQVARSGNTGETYAFDENGMLLSQSRFDEELKQIGLLADLPDSRSILTLEVRDPKVNLTNGERPSLRRASQPLTRMAAAATAGQGGVDAAGYRDYRGVPVVGAWRWLPDHDMGVATEIEVSEAFRPEYVLRRAFWGLMGLLLLSAAGIFFAMLYIAHQQKALQKATLEAKQLGQYTLVEKLGAGGMGTVYKARHAMLRRPTAVKLLDIDKMAGGAVARFEREVQLTSGLTHPNTVAVFDYGRTPEGLFYYAMEYLEGTNLDDFVSRYGALPEARALFLLRQICGSLAEAHAAELVHRDVKPANIFLTRRGGLHDFVKVLDFGLVKAHDDGADSHLTSPNAVTGTPLYMAPEAVNHPDLVDARSDVYAIGAVGYFLLTGTAVFNGTSVLDICMKHVQTEPEPPSARLGKKVHLGLEALILRCLAKSQAERPADAAALLHELDACTVEGRWTAVEAAAWWQAQGTFMDKRPKLSSPGILTTKEPETTAPQATIMYEKNGQ